MNFFEMINAVLRQLELPEIDTFNDAKLPMHIKIMAYINRANQYIILGDDWWFKKIYTQINTQNGSNNMPLGRNELINISANDGNIDIFYDIKDFVKDEFGNLKQNFETETDKTIMPEPFGSDLIVYWVCLELKQEPNNPKYNHWKSRYNNAFAQLRTLGKPYDGKPVFKIKRG